MISRFACAIAILLSCVLECSPLQKVCIHLSPTVALADSHSQPKKHSGEQSELLGDVESDGSEELDSLYQKQFSLGRDLVDYPSAVDLSRLESRSSPPFSSRDPPGSINLLDLPV